jgi:predicted RNA-binding protein YlqC (UPF0109 family)
MGGDPTAIIELVEHIAKAIVDNPDHMRVHGIEGEYTLIIELRVAKDKRHVLEVLD